MTVLHAVYVRVAKQDATEEYPYQVYRLTDYVEFGLAQALYQGLQPYAATEDIVTVYVRPRYTPVVIDFFVRSQSDPSFSRCPRFTECVLRRYSKRGYTTDIGAAKAWNKSIGSRYVGAKGGWITDITTNQIVCQGWISLLHTKSQPVFTSYTQHSVGDGSTPAYHYLIERNGNPFAGIATRWRNRYDNERTARQLTAFCSDCGELVPAYSTGMGEIGSIPVVCACSSQYGFGHRVHRDVLEGAQSVLQGLSTEEDYYAAFPISIRQAGQKG